MNKFQKKQCKSVIKKLCSMEISIPFQSDMSMKYGITESIKNYLQNPVNISIVKKRLYENHYQSLLEFESDVRLIWSNAMSLFQKGSAIFAMAEDCSVWFDKQMEQFPRSENELWLIKFNKIHRKLNNLVFSFPDREVVRKYREEKKMQQLRQMEKEQEPAQEKQTKHEEDVKIPEKKENKVKEEPVYNENKNEEKPIKNKEKEEEFVPKYKPIPRPPLEKSKIEPKKEFDPKKVELFDSF